LSARFGFASACQHGASRLVSFSRSGLASQRVRNRGEAPTLAVPPRDEFLKAEPGEARRSVLKACAAGVL
jgi:hypothetical protein